MDARGIALVTGASRGIGRAVALELARRGFDVVATMRHPDAAGTLSDEAHAAGGRLTVAPLDVTDAGGFQPPEGLRVLVNNAGVDGEWLPVEQTTVASWRHVFETNVFGLVALTRRAIPVLRAAGGGVICNVTSCSTLAPMPLFAAYRASKAAVSAFGESLRVEVAPAGIRVVEIMPGAIGTDMLARAGTATDGALPEPYTALGQRVHASQVAAQAAPTPVAAAATATVDALLDDGGPVRCAIDPMGAALLEAWRRGEDEQMQVEFRRIFADDA
jgi:NAD(P)-dependent dehydrogenase (short-subunit alcohol dehydrogenase family)